MPSASVFIVNFEHLIAGWITTKVMSLEWWRHQYPSNQSELIWVLSLSKFDVYKEVTIFSQESLDLKMISHEWSWN